MKKVVFLLLAAICGFALADNPYGVCAHITRSEPSARTCRLMAYAGIGWVRSDFDWSYIEGREGRWRWEKFDRVIDEAEKEGVQLLPILAPSRPWSDPVWEHLDKWGEYVERVVKRYGKRLPVLEIWNEQNLNRRASVTNYVTSLKKAYEVIKSIDPELKVSIGGFAHVPLKYIEQVYELGGAQYFDIMNVHPYSHPRPPEGSLDLQIDRLRELMAKYGDAKKPIWITEIGWPTHQLKLEWHGFLKSALHVIDPQKKNWNVMYIPIDSEVSKAPMEKALLEVLPENSTVEICEVDNVATRLKSGKIDVVIHPFSDEDYPCECFESVYQFVKDGGVLVNAGGYPMNFAWKRNEAGGWARANDVSARADRKKLRIDVTAWYMDRRYPKMISLEATEDGKGIEFPEKGLEAGRFFKPSYLKEGDKFIPLLVGKTNDLEAAAVVVQKYNSDMKGAVVLCGLPKGRAFSTSDEDRQARMISRALGISFACGIEKFFPYEFRQTDGDSYHHESFFGLVRQNFSPKPAYGAYLTFIDQRPAGSVQLDGAWKNIEKGFYYPQWKRPDGMNAGMIWSNKIHENQMLEFTSQEMKFFNVNGDRLRPERVGNTYRIFVSPSPIYFQGGMFVRQNEMAERIERAKAVALKQIEEGIIQGAVFTASGYPITAVGYQCVKPVKRPMTVNSRFDMASVGKLFTASCCALLMCDGKLDLDAPFTKYLPEHTLSQTNCEITVRDMGMHASGFNNSKPYFGIRNDMAKFNKIFFAKMPVRPRLAAFEYSCFNFISLGKIINKLTSKDLDAYARQRIWGPLGMKNTQWHAPGDGPNEVEHWFPNRPAGQHNDGVCYDCPEPLGNGSCFSTAADMMLFVQDFLDRKTFPNEYYNLLMTQGFENGGYRRTFGWEMTDKRRPAGLSSKAIFHTGWSGQTVCVDPENNFAAVVLTSRTGDYEKARAGRAKIISILFGESDVRKRSLQ